MADPRNSPCISHSSPCHLLISWMEKTKQRKICLLIIMGVRHDKFNSCPGMCSSDKEGFVVSDILGFHLPKGVR